MGKHYMPLMSDTGDARKLAVRHADDALRTSAWLLDQFEHRLSDAPWMTQAERSIAKAQLSLLKSKRKSLSAAHSRVCRIPSTEVVDITAFFSLYDAFLNEALQARRR